MTPRLAFTVGYQGVEPDALVQSLAAAGVTTVVDTRRTPTSRRPHYRREALRQRLDDSGIGYVSRPTLGVPKPIRALADSRRWMFDLAYRGILGRASADVDAAVAMTETETIALLCFEVDPGSCHRALLATEMAARAPILFAHLRPGDGEDANDHPRPVLVMGADDQVELAPR